MKNYQVVYPEMGKVELQEAPMPVAGENEVLIKTLVSQISTGTELTMLEGNVDADSPWAKINLFYPLLPGYSNVGEIIAVGPGVDPALIGKKCLSDCTHGKYVVSSIVDTHTFQIIPDGVDLDEAAFGVISQITLGNVRAAQIRIGETIVVYGAGLIGQMVTRFARIAGAYNVIVVDMSDKRLEMLPDDECVFGINPKKVDVIEFIKEKNGGKLADIVFETTGAQALIETELECIGNNGKLIITSSPKGKSTVSFDFCSRRGITIIGAHNWLCHPLVATDQNPWTRRRDTQYHLDLLARHQLSLKHMITHKANYKDAPEMYKMLVKDRSQALAVHLYWED